MKNLVKSLTTHTSTINPQSVMRMKSESIYITNIERIKTTYRNTNYGRFEWETVIDLSDHRRRPLSRSEVSYQLLYGPEWTKISREAKALVNYRCSDCRMKFAPSDLNTHHERPISWFQRMGQGPDEDTHTCHGVDTNKPWHTEENLTVLCRDHHADRHPHMKRRGYSTTQPLEEKKDAPRVAKKKKKVRRRNWQWNFQDD